MKTTAEAKPTAPTAQPAAPLAAAPSTIAGGDYISETLAQLKKIYDADYQSFHPRFVDVVFVVVASGNDACLNAIFKEYPDFDPQNFAIKTSNNQRLFAATGATPIEKLNTMSLLLHRQAARVAQLREGAFIFAAILELQKKS